MLAARRAPLLLVGLVMGGLLAPAPAVGGESFSARVRATEFTRPAADRRHRRAHAAPGRYAYYTVGDVLEVLRARPAGRPGYVPGGLWSCYQLTGRALVARPGDRDARRAIGSRAGHRGLPSTLGALFFPSYARGYSLTGDARLRRKGARGGHERGPALRPRGRGHAVAVRRGRFNVIIDSLSMKSQLLWWAARNGGPPELADIARQHVADHRP